MGKRKVLLDLDGVIRDWVGGLVKTYKEKYPTHVINDVISRDIRNYFPIGKKIEQFIENNNQEIILNALPYNNAIQSLDYWSSYFDIIIVTSQLDYAIKDTEDWIKRYKLPVTEVIISFEKHKIDGIALLDDFIDNLDGFQQTGRLSVCYDQPWNQDWKDDRVNSIDEYFKLVNKKII